MHSKTKKLEAEILGIKIALKHVIEEMFEQTERDAALKKTLIELSEARPELPFDDTELDVLRETLEFILKP